MEVKIKLFLITLLSLISACWLHSAEIAKPVYYKLKVKIEPSSGEIFVNGKVEILLESSAQKKISFDLHKTFAIEKLLIAGKSTNYSTKNNAPLPIIPASKKVIVELPEKNLPKKLALEIDYHGKLKDIPEFGTYEDQNLALDDQINSRMVELACYSCWYPFFEFGMKFDIDLELLLPPGWRCVCSGTAVEIKKTGSGVRSRWHAEKDIDIVIVASPELKRKIIKTSATRIDIYYTELPEEFLTREAAEIEKALSLFTELLGKPQLSGKSIKQVYSPKRKGQGSISRTGMIITSEGRTLKEIAKDPEISYLHGIAHEMAHFWWNFGVEQGDWINETFAEYFSLVAIQKILSDEKYKSSLENYKEWVSQLPADAPSLSMVPPINDQVGYGVRYFKGSLMLDGIRNLLGDETFFKICHDFYQQFHDNAANTTKFRKFWDARMKQHENILNRWLDSKGGIPELEGMQNQ